MASAIIHMAVAKRIKEKMNIKLNEREYYLGTIAPDISKEINRKREESHFETNGKIDIDLFIKKYRKYLKNPFELGYFIHLCTDLLWQERFLNQILDNNKITLIDGSKIELDKDKVKEIIYNDYSNMNILLLEEYNMDLSLFYEEFSYPVIYIEEIPNNLLNLIVNKIGIISANSTVSKTYLFDIEKIKIFIEEASSFCIEKINKLSK